MDNRVTARHDPASETDDSASGTEDRYTRSQRGTRLIRRVHQQRRARARMGWARANRASLASDILRRDLFDAAPDALIVVDDAREVALVNQSVDRLLGYERQELLGQSVAML